MKKIFKSICVLLSLFTIFGFGPIKTIFNVHAAIPTIKEYRITSGNSRADYPRIFGNKIVYTDLKGGNDDIYVADISDPDNPIIKQVTDDAAWQSNPDIWGNIIVWDDMRNGNQHDIWMADISDMNNIVQTRVTTDPGKQNAPDIYENKIVWEDYRNDGGVPDAYMADISNRDDIKEYRITTDPSAQYAVSIYGNIIVWEDKRIQGLLGKYTDVYMADISDLNNIIETRITTDQINGSYPQISQNKVVWFDFSDNPQSPGNFNNDVYVADISSPQQVIIKKITDSLSAQFGAEIDNNVVVWDDQRAGLGKDNIYMANVSDLNNIVEAQISNSGFGGYPRVSGNKITWSDVRNDTHEPKYMGNIYLATFTYLDVTSPTFSNLPNGNSPINISEGQYVTTNPYVIKVKPTDNIGISNVKFYIDDNLICTATTADADGVYSCSWDTSRYHSVVKVVAYDSSNNPSELLTKTTTVDPALYVGQTPALTELPVTGKE